MRTSPDRYRRVGHGEPVLLIHPFTLSHHVWRRTADLLADDHDVLAVSMPGHWGGEQIRALDVSIEHYADGVERVLDEVGWGDCHVVGNSLGGWVGFELERRGRARSLTAIAPAGGWSDLSPSELRLGAIFLALTPIAAVGRVVGMPASRLAVVRRLVLSLLSDDAASVPEREVRTVIRAATRCRVFLPTEWMGLRDGGIRGLDRVRVSTLLALCEHDRMLPIETYGRRFLDELPDWAGRVVLPGVGHVPMLENPDLVAETIRGHVAATAMGKPLAR
ncbi:alpha/beta fold hydrolase [Rhodococcus sp. NPDC058505]|uniref:alpha/beta fold hydrolase n=1 Tax=unclassified Rhodococcus (in: high G+C Gram-positive bacteria) TaxID=192944 RepID=UPI00365FC224